MIDTIYIDVPNQYLQKLENNLTTVDNETGEFIYSNGYKGHIKIRQFQSHIRIEVSLSKVFFGSNIYSLTFQQMNLALRKIEFELGISIYDGIIRQLDIENTLNTKYKPKKYFKYLGNSRYYIRFITGGTSLYYKNNNREINIYDKIREMKNKRGIIPLEYTGENVMRIETRYKNAFLKRFAKKNGVNILKVKDITNPNIYRALLDLVFNEYQSIYKESISAASISSISTKKNLLEALAREAIIHQGGASKIEEMIDAVKLYSPDTPKEYFSRRKSEVRDLLKGGHFVEKSNILKEINNKVETIYNTRKNEINDFINGNKKFL